MAQEPVFLEEDGDLRRHLVPRGGLPDAAHAWLPPGEATIFGDLEEKVELWSFVKIMDSSGCRYLSDVPSLPREELVDVLLLGLVVEQTLGMWSINHSVN